MPIRDSRRGKFPPNGPLDFATETSRGGVFSLYEVPTPTRSCTPAKRSVGVGGVQLGGGFGQTGSCTDYNEENPVTLRISLSIL